MIIFEIFSKFGKTKLITIFEVSVIGGMFLNRIVREVHPVVGECRRVGGVLGGAGADVAFAKEVAIEVVGD